MAPTLRTFNQPYDQAAWDECIAAGSGHLLQSWAWGELKSRFGWRARRWALGSVCAQVLIRPLPAGLGSIAYVPRGPVAVWTDDRGLAPLLEALRPHLRRERAICLKLEPHLEDTPTAAGRLRSLGFRPSGHTVQPRRTLVVDLEAEPGEILARMKQKTRYNIRLAGRRGVAVRAGDEADLPAVYRLMETTAARDHFGIHTQAYYETAHRLFVPRGHGRLLLAVHEGQLLAALVAFAFGDTAIYMYGASADEGRHLMPTYLLQWEAMLWAREQGFRKYDLWGVPDKEAETLEESFTERSDGLWGVYRFKRGFGGRLVRTTGAWDLVYAPLRYRLYITAVKQFAQRDTG